MPSLSVNLLVLSVAMAAASPASAQQPGEVPQVVVTPADPAPAPEQPVAEPAAGPAVSEPATPAPAASEPAPAAPPPADTGAIVVTGRGKPPPTDPLQSVNVKSYEVVQSVDRAVVGPVAMTYAKRVPRPIRAGVHNVLMLLDEPSVFVNFLLQFKIGKAMETLARVALNGTLGLGGLIDVAKDPSINLPHRRNGFANTMGFYGLGPGPYLFVPLIGSTTVRDLAGRMMDLSLLSVTVGGPFASPYYGPARGTMASIDDRVEFDAELRRLRDESPDGYGSLRAYYLNRRKAEIEALHGRQPAPPPPPAPAAGPAQGTLPVVTD
jgi:phospholipid-binding lipoprotein MlaA